MYYLTDPSDRSFPGDSEEKLGRWVEISENVGGHMTFVIITKDGKGQQIERSVLRPATPGMPNFRADKEAKAELDPDQPFSDAIFGKVMILKAYPSLRQMKSKMNQLHAVNLVINSNSALLTGIQLVQL